MRVASWGRHELGCAKPGRERLEALWLTAQPGVTAPIASATNEEQLVDLAGATKLRLDADSIQKLNEASACKVLAVTVAGQKANGGEERVGDHLRQYRPTRVPGLGLHSTRGSNKGPCIPYCAV